MRSWRILAANTQDRPRIGMIVALVPIYLRVELIFGFGRRCKCSKRLFQQDSILCRLLVGWFFPKRLGADCSRGYENDNRESFHATSSPAFHAGPYESPPFRTLTSAPQSTLAVIDVVCKYVVEIIIYLPEASWAQTAKRTLVEGSPGAQFVRRRRKVSGRNSVPTTNVIKAMTIGYQRP